MPLPDASTTDFAIATSGADGVTVPLVHGGSVLPGRHRPSSGGVTDAVFSIYVGAGVATVPTIV